MADTRKGRPRSRLHATPALALMLAPLPAVAQQGFTMKIGTVVVNDPIHWSMDEYKRRIEARTGGRIKAEVYPASQLGTMFRMVEGLQLGTIEMLVSSPAFYASLHPAFHVVDTPGIFADFHHAQRVFIDPDFRAKYLALGEAKGVVGIGLWSYGGTRYAATRPMPTLVDFQGKKFRILATKLETEVMTMLGATGIPVPFGEMAQAVQQGTIDGIRATIVVLTGPRMFQVAKYVTMLDDGVIPAFSGVSVPFLNRLPADLRRDVIEVGKEMDQLANQRTVEANRQAEAAWRQGGGEVVLLSATERAEMQRRLAPIGDAVLGTSPQTKEMWELTKGVAAKHRAG